MMIHMKRYPIRKFTGMGLMIASGMLCTLFAQIAKPDAPLVIDGKIPIYPVSAVVAHIQGVVKIRVTTDGEKVTSADVVSGPPMLARSTKANVLTWAFSKHKPTTFVATFDYEIAEPSQCTFTNGSSSLNLPLEVHIYARGVETCDPAVETKPHR